MEQKKEKKQKAPAVVATPVVKVVKPPRTKHPLRGSARAARRVGLVKNWRRIDGAKQMLPPVGEKPIGAV